MTPNEAKVVIESAISDGPNDYYKMAVGVAEWTQRMATGKGHDKKGIVQGDWLAEVRLKETEDEKKNRKHLYRPATKTACRPVMVQHSKVYRVDGIKDEIQPKDREEEIREAVKYFHSGRELFSYLSVEQVRQEFSDPNAYLIVLKREQRNVANVIDKITTYPVVIPSVEIPRQKIVNGETEWIVRKQTFKTVKGASYDVFTLYAAGIVVVYREIVDGLPPNKDEVSTSKVVVENKTYEAAFYINTGTTEFPGIQWGTFQALGEEHKVSALDPASDLLDELVRKKSIYDVAVDMHVRPHRYEFVGECEYSEGSNNCHLGQISYMDEDASEKFKACPGCGGTGYNRPKTENNVTRVKFPEIEDGKEFIDLSKLYHYEDIDLKTVVELGEIKDSLINMVPYSVFSAQAEATPLITRTATENLLEAENINNQVMPFANHGSRIYEKVIRLTAQYMGIKDVTVTHSFPENLKLESLNNLLDRLAKAKSAGASQEAIFAVQCEITAKTNAGNQVTIANLKAFEKHRPFRSMEPAVVSTILLERAPNDPDRQAFENWDRIKTDLLEKYPNFFNLEYPDQAKKIKGKAEELAGMTVYSGSDEPELSLSELE